MNFIQGDILELQNGKIATVVQLQGNVCVCLDGVYPPKDLPPTEWQFWNIRESEVKSKIGNLKDKSAVEKALIKHKVYLN